MTKRDFFILLIKAFGLFSVITSLFSTLPSNFYFATIELDAISIIWIVVTTAIMGGLFVLLIFKAGKVVDILKLDKGFDDDRIEFSGLTSAHIIKTAVFIIGGFLILENIPPFLSHTLFEFKADVAGYNLNGRDHFRWAVSALNVVIGYLLLTNYEWVARKLEAKKEE